MKKRIQVVGLAVGLGLVAIALPAASSARSGGPRSFTLLERGKGSTFKVIDIPPKSKRRHGFPTRLSTGDQFIVRIPLVTPARKRRVGTLHAACTVTKAMRSFERSTLLCAGVVRLRRQGSLAISGAFRAGRTVKFAITGGTGAFEGASGSFTSSERRGKPSIDRFRLTG